MAGLLKTLLWVVFGYYLFKIIVRFLLPLFLNRYLSKKMKEMQDQSEQQRKEDVTFADGETTITKQGENKQDDVEYVDYEEVD